MNKIEVCYKCKDEFEFNDSEIFYCSKCNKSICGDCLEKEMGKLIEEIMENNIECSYCRNK